MLSHVSALKAYSDGNCLACADCTATESRYCPWHKKLRIKRLNIKFAILSKHCDVFLCNHNY